MRLNDCIAKMNSTGPCPIDRDVALKYFTKRCAISEYKNEYRLIRMTHKQVFSMKVTISEEDAKFLINKLKLVECSSGVFNYGSTFVMSGVNPLKI